MKYFRFLLVITMIIATSIMLSACAKKVPQEEYDKALEQISQLEEDISKAEQEAAGQKEDLNKLQTTCDELEKENEELREENKNLLEENEEINSQLTEYQEAEKKAEEERKKEEDKELESLIGMVYASEDPYTETKGYYAIAGPTDMISYVIFTGDSQAPIMLARKRADLSYEEVAKSVTKEGIEGTSRPYRSAISKEDGKYRVDISYTDVLSQEHIKYSFDFYVNTKGPEYGIAISNVETDSEQPEVWDGHYLVAK